jgi:predicted DNA-binding transcriptional regulator AlpA
MINRLYAYGLTAAAALTGGSVLFYLATHPGGGVTGDDIAELQEAINERRAALAATHAAVGTNGVYDFTAITNLAGAPEADQMREIMDGIIDLAPSFVEWVSNGVPIMLTAPRLFQLAGVGPADGTQAVYTVSVLTNGVPIYSNAPSLGVWTGLLWECHRALSNMTTTVRDPEWVAGPRYNDDSSWTWFMRADNEIIPKTDPPPAWWVSTAGYTFGIATGALDTGEDVMRADWIHYGYNGEQAAAPFERVVLTAPSGGEGQRNTWGGDPSYWIYITPSASVEQDCMRLDSSGGVWVAGMASGVTCEVSMPWSYTGALETVSVYGTDSYSMNGAGTTVVPLAFSGDITGRQFAVATGYLYRIDQISPFTGFTNLNAAGSWSNSVSPYMIYGDTNVYYTTNAGSYTHFPPPSIIGSTSVQFDRQAILRWHFSRCHP